MTEATNRATPVLRLQQVRDPEETRDTLLALTRRLDQYRRSARRRGQYVLAADLSQARKLLLTLHMCLAWHWDAAEEIGQ
jgi:hypothetical protein